MKRKASIVGIAADRDYGAQGRAAHTAAAKRLKSGKPSGNPQLEAYAGVLGGTHVAAITPPEFGTADVVIKPTAAERRIIEAVKSLTIVKRPRRVVRVRFSGVCGDNPFSNISRDMAVTNAAKLAEGLGDAWEGHVWESGGWHFSAKLGKCEVYDHGGRGGTMSARRYWANLVDSDKIPTVCAHGRTSREAVNKVIREAELIAARLADAALELRE